MVSVAAVPLVYAAAMAAAAVAALATGWLHDRWKGRVLLGLPVLVAAVPALAFSGTWIVALAGVLIWGAAGGVQDSTVKALVAQLVPAGRRATATACSRRSRVRRRSRAGRSPARCPTARCLPWSPWWRVLQVVALVLLVRTLRQHPLRERA